MRESWKTPPGGGGWIHRPVNVSSTNVAAAKPCTAGRVVKMPKIAGFRGFTGLGYGTPRASVARFRVVDGGEFQIHTAIMMKMEESISLGGRAA
jgi:hypothetical protein